MGSTLAAAISNMNERLDKIEGSNFEDGGAKKAAPGIWRYL